MVSGKYCEEAEMCENSSGESAPERLLDAWLQASIAIRNERFVKELTYNESIICKLLSDAAEEGGEGMTATDLCAATHMKKSQMNRTLNDMEKNGLIERSTAKDDHRKQLIKIRDSQLCRFEQQHDRIIEFVKSIMGELGQKRSNELEAALKGLAAAVRKVNMAQAGALR